MVACLGLVACTAGLSDATDAPDPGETGDTSIPQDCPVDACPGGCTDIDTDPLNCGGCGITCVLPHADPACVLGECALGGCDVGWADCDGDPVNGCEAEALCDPGTPCTTTCDSQGTLDCTDACAPVCVPPVETCNLADDDCDGACDNDLPGCHRIVYRSSGPLGHLYGHETAEATSAGQRIEDADYFRLASASDGAGSALYRCTKGGGRRFLTTSSRCEGLDKPPELTLGWLAPGPVCGATPLYRMYSGSASNHFYTTSARERDRAVELGYRLEGTVGYVLPGG